MAKGYDQYMERKNKVNSFGRELTRRAKSKCELCEATGVSLSVFEIPPIKEEPEIERCIFICEDCKNKLERIKKSKENDFRFLSNSIWSEVDIVRAFSILLLREMAKKYSWAELISDDLYVDEDTEKLIEMLSCE
ncbi:PhnA protein [Candidatus Cetobacterium colombiensis]|uniref:PhnA protein n=1 Tax=Candidatus Cetobacterium colombiensis TaxID=3073100 RepID=A0ABU4W7Y6_9FUSO|nr:PhnA protein [Candidatus Cetobacterium colombiensis]MDX8335642.1 PhnA protein [Candidatus Cetobacterium colombiensis]